MVNLFADESFSFPVVEVLRQFGHDIVTVQNAVWAVCRFRIGKSFDWQLANDVPC